MALGEIRAIDWRVICSPHHNHQDNASHEVATQLWFDQHLKQSFAWPRTPETRLELETAAHIPLLTVRPDSTLPILSVEVYYTQDADPEADRDGVVNRFWHYAPTTQRDRVWSASLPLTSTAKPLWAYANVYYALKEPVTGAGYYYRVYTANQFVLSSPLSKASASELHAAQSMATRGPTPIIESFEGDWEKAWFTYRLEDWARRTHKVNDPTWAPPPNAQLSIEVRAAEQNQLVIGVDSYASVISLAGSENWQSFTLAPSDFSDARDETLKSFTGIMELRLTAQETLRARRPDARRTVGARWDGPAPEFRDLKWVVP